MFFDRDRCSLVVSIKSESHAEEKEKKESNIRLCMKLNVKMISYPETESLSIICL